jgi:hypothetical protein
MENDSVDTLFEKIKNLENEESQLYDKLENLEIEIENKKLSELQKFWSKNEDEKEEKEFIKTINDLKTKIKNCLELKSIEYTFQYIPFDSSFSNVYISGDFNNWNMTEMNKVDNTDELKFNCNFNLEKGFEYAYCFFSNGERLIDFNQPSKNISYKENEEYNYIDIPDDNGKFIQFNKDKFSMENNVNNNSENLIKIKGNENDFINSVLQLNDMIYKKKNILLNQNDILTDEINAKYNSSKNEYSNDIEKDYNEFIEKFKGRIIVYENINYIINDLNIEDFTIKGIRLYDSNGIKVNISKQIEFNTYTFIPIQSIFNSSYILSKEESEKIIKAQKNDNSNYIKILYQIQQNIDNPNEKELIPYRIIPSNVDINEYDIEIKDNLIKTIYHKQNNSYIIFESIMVGDNQKSGLVSNDPIIVYTTLYNKDILNILHIHLNDTSEEITIESEFLENNENILNHKIFTTDITGRRLSYKLIFKQYKLIKIYYCMSIDFIDEPPFKEIKYSPNNYVKISKGEYKNYYGKIIEFPMGMLARKDKENTKIEKMKSFSEKKEGYCNERHLDSLLEFVLVEIMFYPGSEIKKIKDNIKISIPVCHLIPLSPKEEIRFEKSILLENNNEVMEIYNIGKELEKYLNNEKLLDEFDLNKIKEMLNLAEKINNDFKNLDDDLDDKIKFAYNIKGKIIPILQQRIRLHVLSLKNNS